MNKIKFGLFCLILILGFVVRMYKIDNPVADWHSWRQADTAAVTRNFVKYGPNVFMPRYDDFYDASGKGLVNPSGFRMVEFPLFNLIHYVFYTLYPAWGLIYWGRMTAILAWLLAAGVLFTIVKRHQGDRVAFVALSLFVFFPYAIYFSRIILPDQLMIALSLLTLNSFDLWITRNNKLQLVLSIVFGALALLVKPMAVFLLLPILWQARTRLRDFRIYAVAAGMALPFLLWREWISKFPEGIPASLWLLNGNGIRFKPAFFRWIFGERIASLILGKWGLVPFFSGIIASIASPYFLMWLLGAIVYLVVFATGNIQHDYYQIVIIPAMAVITAMGIVRLFTPERGMAETLAKRVLLGVCLVFMLAFSWYDVVGDYQVNHWEIIRAGAAVQRLTQAKAIIVAAYMGDTAFLYQTNRRGFALVAGIIKDMKDLWGVSYYVSTNYDEETTKIMQKYSIVEETPEYVLVRLEEPQIILPK